MSGVLLYGGSFNPPHLGHVSALRAAAEQLSPERVLVIPASIPPHKDIPVGSPSADERLELTRLAFSSIPGAEVSDIELRREGKSYTVDTLREIGALYPGEELYFLVGTDMLLYIENWYEFRSVLSLCTLCVLAREEGETETIREFAERLTALYGARIEIIPAKPFPMSSTAVREALPRREGREALPPDVYAEIIRRRYYGAKPELNWLRERTDECLKPRRILHVRGCEETARRLAERWGEDADDAAEAGILHDITKRLDGEEQLRLCEKYGIVLTKAERRDASTLHARTGAHYARERFGVSDRVFSAIEWHTTGREDMTTLEKIVYLADFIEPNRAFPGVDDVRALALEDLDAALVLAMEMGLESLKKRGIVPLERTETALISLRQRMNRK